MELLVFSPNLSYIVAHGPSSLGLKICALYFGSYQELACSTLTFSLLMYQEHFKGNEVVMEPESIRGFQSGPKGQGKISKFLEKIQSEGIFQFQIKYLSVLLFSLAPTNARILTKLH